MWSQTCEAWIERRNVDPSFTLLFSSRLSESAATRVSVWQWRGLLMFKTAECFPPGQWVSAVKDTASTRPCFSTLAGSVTNRKTGIEHYVWSLVWLLSVAQASTLVQTEISHQLLNGLLYSLAQTFMVSRGWLQLTLVIPRFFLFSARLRPKFSFLQYFGLWSQTYKIKGIYFRKHLHAWL